MGALRYPKSLTMPYQITLDTAPNFNDIAVLHDHDLTAQEVEPRRELAIFLRDPQGVINGGVYGWLSQGWLCVDTLWLHQRLRGQDYGTRLLTALEQAALLHGVSRSFLTTTSFQARPFYEKRGYRVFLTHRQFINGHDIYFLRKDEILRATPHPALVVEAPPKPEDVDTLSNNLTAFNAPYVGNPVYGGLAVYVRDAHTIVGGIAGWRYAHTFSADLIWLDEPLRQAGAAAEAVKVLVKELSSGGMPDVNVRLVGTTNALPVFEAAGFVHVGKHDDFPMGSATYYLQKWV